MCESRGRRKKDIKRMVILRKMRRCKIKKEKDMYALRVNADANARLQKKSQIFHVPQSSRCTAAWGNGEMAHCNYV